MDAPENPLDLQLIAESFATDDPADQAGVREMVELLRADVMARLAALSDGAATLAGAAAARELHQLRGAVSGFGLVAATERLTALERAWPQLTPAARAAAVAAAREAFAAGLRALAARLPYLQ